ncbi:Protein CBG27225 [Caenorhabditis briggsae]|uniref:Protein CBG27225 n=1 Tax=Caenorhabditis briggsae TaxID=6238 RepID=B6IFU8_CAEBR|nr:Protein CBG27225 [Caenorhabditis briggsae]CAR98764.1 Protein CBG27225 [Caenorhabditis briggsae]
MSENRIAPFFSSEKTMSCSIFILSVATSDNLEETLYIYGGLYFAYRCLNIGKTMCYEGELQPNKYYINHVKLLSIGGMVHSVIQLYLKLYLDFQLWSHYIVLCATIACYTAFFIHQTWKIIDFCATDRGIMYFFSTGTLLLSATSFSKTFEARWSGCCMFTLQSNRLVFCS